MANRGYSRLLITWALAAALSAGLAPTLRAGEPDYPPQAPPPIKVALLPAGSATSSTSGVGTRSAVGRNAAARAESNWVLQLRWSLRVLLVQLPKRFP